MVAIFFLNKSMVAPSLHLWIEWRTCTMWLNGGNETTLETGDSPCSLEARKKAYFMQALKIVYCTPREENEKISQIDKHAVSGVLYFLRW